MHISRRSRAGLEQPFTFTQCGYRTVKMLQANLEAAGIPDRDDIGCVVDFHALRHTYISRLVASGANTEVAQELTRHSTPTLTLGRYAHVQLVDQTRALAALPSIEARRANHPAPAATGT